MLECNKWWGRICFKNNAMRQHWLCAMQGCNEDFPGGEGNRVVMTSLALSLLLFLGRHRCRLYVVSHQPIKGLRTNSDFCTEPLYHDQTSVDIWFRFTALHCTQPMLPHGVVFKKFCPIICYILTFRIRSGNYHWATCACQMQIKASDWHWLPWSSSLSCFCVHSWFNVFKDAI